ncbi:MAG: hypothetical protein EPO24_01125 [Bacteroidetes bacterium]|nr:MAG: hypothetical protein EPO24_01125 [Bacteroidota bacterium]
MKKNLRYYLSLNYPIHVERMKDGMYCASISLVRGCKGYATDIAQAVEELQGVKESLFELMMEQGKTIPEPTVHLEIPVREFERLPSRKRLGRFVKTAV